jgi:hypothetical protein
MRCATFHELVSGALDHRLDDGRLRDFEEHRRACPACGAYLIASVRALEAARKATAIEPGPGFEEGVMERVRRMPSRLWEVAPAAAPPARRWFPLGAAAGILVGVLLGAAGTLGLRSLAVAPGGSSPGGAEEPAPDVLTGSKPFLPASAAATAGNRGELEDFGSFLKASEMVNSGITAVPWGDVVGSAFLLNRIVEGLQMEKAMEKAEKARPAIAKAKPEVAALADDLIRGQKDVLLCLSDPNSISPEEIQAKAQVNLGKIQRTQYVLHLDRPGMKGAARRGVRLSLGNLPPNLPEDVAAMVKALAKELDGDPEGAAVLYDNFHKEFRDSRLKYFALARQMMAQRQPGMEDMIVSAFKDLPEGIFVGDLPPAVESQIRIVIQNHEGLEPALVLTLNRAMDELRNCAVKCPIRDFQVVRLNEIDVPVEVQQRNRGVLFSLYTMLRAKHARREWTVREESAGGENVKTAHFERAKDGALDPGTHFVMKLLTKDVRPVVEPEAVTLVHLEGQ